MHYSAFRLFPLFRVVSRAWGNAMLISCWSVKGGSGTTVIAAAIALALARSMPTTLVDFGGDVPTVLGLPDPEGFGLADWLAAGPDVPGEALDRVAVPAAPGLTL